MTIHKTGQEVDENLMRSFFTFLGKQEQDLTKTAFILATQENTGTYSDMFLDAYMLQLFCLFLAQENNTLVNKMMKEKGVPIRDLLKLGLIKSNVEIFKTY